MKRQIVEINEALCNGCGQCITGCAEGALQIVNGKAKLVKETFCDGLGSCIGTCPTGALSIIERDARPFDRNAVEKNSKTNECPALSMGKESKQQWPVQLHLVTPNHPALVKRELVILSTCSPVLSSSICSKYTKDRGMVVACPKLDQTAPYIDKLASIFQEAQIPKVIILRVEVPCCGGLTQLTKAAAIKSNRTDLIIEEHILGINGLIKEKKLIVY